MSLYVRSKTLMCMAFTMCAHDKTKLESRDVVQPGTSISLLLLSSLLMVLGIENWR
jgi:hypothetical protein